MINLDNVLENLTNEPWYKGQVTHVKVSHPKSAQFDQTEYDLHRSLKGWLEDRSIDLYSHQARAIDLIARDEEILLASPTASGKTLAFNLPVLDHLIRNPESRALYLYPTKALSNDQLNTLREMDQYLGAELAPRVYDGDTPQHMRKRIRNESRVVLSNPYALHHYLPWHEKWDKFFKNLDYIVLDEVHHYRGVFGSNVSFLFRRLQRIAQFYGSDPNFILASATIANPDEHAKQLIGRQPRIISENGSPRGKKFFVLWDSNEDEQTSPHQQTSNLMAYFVSRGMQTLCFTLSRRMAELISKWSDEKTDKTTPVFSYRAGYKPEERREIEKELRSGLLRGVASTNALELGVDIGGLDAVVISGYPGTMVSTWQQAGRAGRGVEQSVAVLVGFENPLDQYFMHNPDRFFGRRLEHAIVDLENEHIVAGSLLCAASELPIKEEEWLFNYVPQIERLQEEGLLRETPMGYVYSGTKRPQQSVQLNNIGEERVEVIDTEGELVETMEVPQAMREAHPGAVMLHQGDTYLVEQLNLDQRVARAEKRTVDYYTQSLSDSNLKTLNTIRSKWIGNLEVSFGRIQVRERYLSYRVKKFGQVVSNHSLNLPPLEFETEGVWISIPQEIAARVERASLDFEGGMHGLEHALIAMVPVHSMCDRWDIGGLSIPSRRDFEHNSVYIYDAYQGGIGISEKIFELIRKLLITTRELVESCNCEDGCPSCIYSPKCGNNNEPLDKEATIFILDRILTG